MDNEAAALSKYRIEQAEQCLNSARLLAQAGDFRGAANRSYYAIFHAMRSVLALERKDFAKHSGVSAYFRKEYIKSGKETQNRCYQSESINKHKPNI